MFLVHWWQGQPVEMSARERLAKQLVQEIEANACFQRCRRDADLGFRFRYMIDECKQRVNRVGAAKGLGLRKRRIVELFDFLGQDEGRQFVRTFGNYSRALFCKLVEFRERFPQPLPMRQLFPSAPPLAECGEWQEHFGDVPSQTT